MAGKRQQRCRACQTSASIGAASLLRVAF